MDSLLFVSGTYFLFVGFFVCFVVPRERENMKFGG